MNGNLFNHHFKERTTRPPTNEIKILRTLARADRPLSVSELVEKTRITQANISRAIIGLIGKGLIPEKKKKKSTLRLPLKDTSISTRDYRYYYLTSEGYMAAIDDIFEIENEDNNWQQITSKEFWQYLFHHSKYFNKEQLDDVCSFYEMRILNVDRNYFVPDLFIRHTNDKLKDVFLESDAVDYYDEIKSIIQTIGMSKSLSFKQLEKIPNFSENVVRYLVLNDYIRRNNDVYQLTHLGLLELLFYLYQDYEVWRREQPPSNLMNNVKSKDRTLEKIRNEFNEIRKNHTHLLPKIFKGISYESLDLEPEVVLDLLISLYKTDPLIGEISFNFTRENLHSEEFEDLQKFDSIRQDSYYRKLREHMRSIGDEKFREIQRAGQDTQNNAFRKYMRDLYYLDGQESQPNWPIESIERIHKQPFWDSQIERKITFDFYSIYKSHKNGWDDNLAESEIRKRHDGEIKTLLTYTKNYLNNMAQSYGMILEPKIQENSIVV